jgi:hypothetical protein
MLSAMVALVLLATRAVAQTEPPSLPITRFPGADLNAITCTPEPGPPPRETPAVRRQILTVISDMQQGRFNPKNEGVGMRYLGPRGTGSFFSRLGPVRRLQFRGASLGCGGTSRYYSYHVIGRDAVADLWFDVHHGLVDGYGQEEHG